MELQIPFSPILFSFLLLIFTVIRTKWNKQKNKAPPGPWKFPFIGNLHQLSGALPYHRFRDLALIYGPIMTIQIGQIQSVVISSAEIAKEVLQSNDFADHPQNLAAKTLYYDRNGITFGEYGDEWRQLRKVCIVEFLSAKRVQSFRPVREQNMSELVEFLRSKSRSPVNLTKTLSAAANLIMMKTTNGTEFKDQEVVFKVLEQVGKAMSSFTVADVFPSLTFLKYFDKQVLKLNELHKQLDKVLQDVINEHIENRKDGENHDQFQNFVDVLLDLQERGNLQVPLTNDSIKSTILEMFEGGSETFVKSVQWAMAELIRHPAEMEKVQKEVRQVFGEKGKVEESRLNELTYLKDVIKETLRLHPPSAFNSRQSNESKKLGAYEIAPSTQVLINLWAINRDPSIWTEPERFYPERFRDNPIDNSGKQFELISFGAGKRICPGMTLATVSMELFLATLLFHFDWEFPVGITAQTFDMTEVLNAFISRKVDLELVPIPFFPLSS